jgi:hypothetical protein
LQARSNIRDRSATGAEFPANHAPLLFCMAALPATRPRKTLEFAYETFEISFLIFSDFVQIERAR